MQKVRMKAIHTRDWGHLKSSWGRYYYCRDDGLAKFYIRHDIVRYLGIERWCVVGVSNNTNDWHYDCGQYTTPAKARTAAIRMAKGDAA